MKTAKPIKTEPEIQKVHDILHGVVDGIVPDVFNTREDKIAATAALEALCWVLNHEHGGGFEKNIEAINKLCERRGFKLKPNELE